MSVKSISSLDVKPRTTVSTRMLSRGMRRMVWSSYRAIWVSWHSQEVRKKYVQHRIAEMGEAAAELLMKKNTHYYVCGDARMTDSCFEACVELLRDHQTMSRVKAVKHLRDMRVKGRWQTDVWGIVSHFNESKKFNEQKVKRRPRDG
jgi:NAD(P)H-flavin reductase